MSKDKKKKKERKKEKERNIGRKKELKRRRKRRGSDTKLERLGELREFFVFVFGYARCMWNILGQGSNPYHTSDLSHSSDDAGSLTARPPGNSKGVLFLILQIYIYIYISFLSFLWLNPGHMEVPRLGV